jgi:exopolysaccharide biosynthesis predicted pyruvyltransferase EpsI
LVTDFHSILAPWRNSFSQLFNVHGVSDVRQTEIHTAEPVVPKSSASEVEIITDTLKSHISSGIDQIPAVLIKAEGTKIRSEIHKLIIYIWYK